MIIVQMTMTSTAGPRLPSWGEHCPTRPSQQALRGTKCGPISDKKNETQKRGHMTRVMMQRSGQAGIPFTACPLRGFMAPGGRTDKE